VPGKSISGALLYGTRVGLEYLRQFPDRVRTAGARRCRATGHAPAASFAVDGQAALDRMIAGCAKDTACAARFPAFGDAVDALFKALHFAAGPDHP